jgi:hypothetical protein
MLMRAAYRYQPPARQLQQLQSPQPPWQQQQGLGERRHGHLAGVRVADASRAPGMFFFFFFLIYH